MVEELKKSEGINEKLEGALKWLEQNDKYVDGISVWDEMDSSRPNVNTLYIAWNRGYGSDSALVVSYHNGIGEKAQVDSIEITSAEAAKEAISHCSDPLPTVNTIEWLRATLETERERQK